MTKVVRIVINHQYTLIGPDILQKDEVVPFDMYIKRYNDLVILIEAGTLLDESLMDKLSHHLEIYILKRDFPKLKSYSSLNPIIRMDVKTDLLEAALALKEKSSLISDIDEKLFFVYSTVSEVMESIFLSGSEKLPIEVLSVCVDEIISVLRCEANVLPIILKMMPDDYSIQSHSTNVAYFSAILGIMLKMKNQELADLTFAALLHDIGKLRIETAILDKPSSLEEDEFESVKHHSQMGCEILEENGIGNQTILSGILHHHERLDGSGYPDQLRGKLIPKTSRIIGVCDVFDALTTNRTFRKNYTSFEALMLMKQQMHKQFDEKLIDLFIQLHR